MASADITTDLAGVADLPESDRHRLLAVEERRIVLDVLADRSLPLELQEVATAIVSREDGATDGDHVRRIAVVLHHNHLPTIAAMGLIDYDPRTTRVDSP